MKKHLICTLATLTLAAIAAPALASQTHPVLDQKTCDIDYPQVSRANEDQGTTTALFYVSATGSVTETKLEKSSGFRDLDKAARRGLSKCKFTPGTKDGVPTATWTRINYIWALPE